MAEMTDEELLFAARESDDNEPLSALISRYIRMISQKAAYMKNAKAEADDLISEGFLGLLSAIHSYNAEKGSFAAFANACVTNRIKTAVYASGKHPQPAADFDFDRLEDTSPAADEVLIEKEAETEVFARLSGQLSGREYQALMLYINAYSYQQIAARLGISIKAVDNALSRARGKLKKNMS